MTIRPPASGPRLRPSPRDVGEGPRAEQVDDATPFGVSVAGAGAAADGFEGCRGADSVRAPRHAQPYQAPQEEVAESLIARAATSRAKTRSLSEGLAAEGFHPEALTRHGAAMREARANLAAVRGELSVARRQRVRAGVAGTPPELGGMRIAPTLEALRDLPSGAARRVEGLRISASLLPVTPTGTPPTARFHPKSPAIGPLLARIVPEAGLASDMTRELSGTAPREEQTMGIDRLQGLLALSGAS